MSGSTPVGRARILLVANLREGGNAADWIGSLEAMGYEVAPFYMLPYRASGGRLARSLGARLNRGPAVTRLNRDLATFAAGLDYDLAFIVKGTWVWPGTVDVLRERAASGHAIHLTIDSLFTDNRSHHFFGSLPLYSIAFTDKRFEKAAYETAGAREVGLFLQGFGRRFAAEVDAGAAPMAVTDVCFVGHCQPHYVNRLAAVAETGADLGIWGPGWSAAAKTGPAWMDRVVRGEGLWGAAYPATMGAARIGIGLLSKRISEEATTRSVEIPATGALLLAERTDLHRELFTEGVEADYFDSDAEMVDKVRYYLANEAVRARVARAGQTRAFEGGYDMDSRLREVMAIVAARTGIAAPLKSSR